jgi:hypothetical protein
VNDRAPTAEQAATVADENGHGRVGRRQVPATVLGAVMLCLVTAVSLVAAAGPAGAQDTATPAQSGGAADDAPSADEVALAERHAPIVFVRQQDAPCDTDGEPFEPAPVDIVLDNPEVLLRQVGNDDPVTVVGPSAADIFDLREGWYLDFPGDALEPGCVFEEDFGRFFDGRSVVYSHVATQADRPGLLALQYWFFWYHNPSKNDHEGDWEFISLLFEADTAAEALTEEPVAIGYAQHEGGERADWDGTKLDREGDRPIVYPAVGSHASYYGQALYFGRSGAEGFGCDNTDGPSRRLDPDVVALPDQVTDPDDPLAWLAFQGRWGQRERAFFNGPTGPYAKGRWDEPITWHENLRDSSFVVPGGDRFGDDVVRSFCSSVEFGSTWLRRSVRSPTTALITMAIVGTLAVATIRSTRWRPVTTSPVRHDRALGQIAGAAYRVWFAKPGVMVAVGLISIPVAFATALVEVAVESLPFVERLLELAGTRSEVGVLIALLVGGIGNLLAFTYISTVVAHVIAASDRTDAERGTPGPPQVRLDGSEVGRLLPAIARAGVVVAGLLISVVGIPWAIRQLVRYQVVPQVIALEGAGGRAALDRSSALVQRRWWWTAGVIAVVQSLIAIGGVAMALVVLLVFPGLPLWFFHVASASIYVISMPLAAAAMTYVYGSLAAAEAAAAEAQSTPSMAPGDALAAAAPRS